MFIINTEGHWFISSYCDLAVIISKWRWSIHSLKLASWTGKSLRGKKYWVKWFQYILEANNQNRSVTFEKVIVWQLVPVHHLENVSSPAIPPGGAPW